MSNNQKNNTKTSKEEQKATQRAKEAERRLAAEKAQKKKRLLTFAGIGGAAAAVVIAGVCIWMNTGSRALHHKVIAESEHYEVTAAMFACYFRQCADSYLKYAEQNEKLTVYDPSVSLKEQEYSNGVTWYDLFIDNTMSTVKRNLQFAEAAYDAGYVMTEEDEADVKKIADEADLSRYQKGVRRSDLEEATRLTILADSFQQETKDQIEVTDDEVNSYYQEHQADYLTVSVMAYSFPWSPEGIVNGDYAEHDKQVAYAQELGECKTQQEFTDYVYRYLTGDLGKTREEAEQIAADVIMTKTITDYPEEVQNWVRGGAKQGETFVWPREDQCYAVTYMLRDEPAADDSKTVDFRVLYLTAADYDGIENAVSFAEELRDEVLAEEDQSAAFSERAFEYSEDAQTYPDGGLVTGYSASRTTYGDEVAAWAFDRERKHGDMTIVSRPGAALLLFFENVNEGSGWQNQVQNDLYQNKLKAFTDACAAFEIRVQEKNYKYITA